MSRLGPRGEEKEYRLDGVMGPQGLLKQKPHRLFSMVSLNLSSIVFCYETRSPLRIESGGLERLLGNAMFGCKKWKGKKEVAARRQRTRAERNEMTSL